MEDKEKLVSFKRIKEIINSLREEDLIHYEGGIKTRTSVDGSSCEVVELTIAFEQKV